ncbi:hypothetical protein [Sphingomonas sp. Leaf343]|uniref:hypothetical protein n=1 Tax=Sphingomonas sp. Leaf343 TaxID=1736345 RepID=UPI000A98D437|nr:hypothetical protein [Sphingomonas sp. Leaf343]
MQQRFVLILLFVLAGCAESTTIYHNRKFDMDRPKVVTTDAYQRSVFFVPDEKDKEIRVCAEAAPDTFSVLSASIAAKLDVKTQQGELAAGLAQSAATIERTQTINLLRESLYRTCERYLSGAISKSTLVVQAARDQRTMLAVLAIEQLTRVTRPASTIISGGATGAAVSNVAAIELATAFRKDRDAARQVVTAAEVKLKVAEAAFAKPNGAKCVGENPMPDGGNEAAWSDCKSAEGEAAVAKANLATQETRLGQALAIGGAAGGTTAAQSRDGPSDPGGGGDVASAAAATGAIAQAIQHIVTVPAIDETLLFCIGYLEKQPNDEKTLKKDETRPALSGDSERATQGLCRGIIAQRSKVEAANSQTLIAKYISSVPLAKDGEDSGADIKRYLKAESLAATERKRRRVVATRASVALGRTDDPDKLIPDLDRGDETRNRELLYVLQALERNWPMDDHPR